jgi:hypothetical protein
MARYTVAYHRQALDELTNIWLAQALARNAIAKASHSIDVALAENGASKGIQVGVRLREYTESPLPLVPIA